MGRVDENYGGLLTLHDSRVAGGVQRVTTEDPIASQQPVVTRNGDVDASPGFGERVGLPIVLGASFDTEQDNAAFAKKFGFPFALAKMLPALPSEYSARPLMLRRVTMLARSTLPRWSGRSTV